jgi:membrane protease YdiL (CAAX protease family)
MADVLGIVAVIVIVLAGNELGAILVVVWALVTHTPWSRLGLKWPANSALTGILGVTIGIALKLIMKALVMPLLGFPPVNAAYHFLAGNPAALPGMILTAVFAAGVGEELIWRGFLFERLRMWLPRVPAQSLVVLTISSVLFGLAHLADQGLPGVAQSTITGLAFGGLFLAAGDLWLPSVAHAAFDVTAVLMIYWNLEEPIAHAIFR